VPKYAKELLLVTCGPVTLCIAGCIVDA